MSTKELLLKPQDSLFEEGERSTSMYIIKRGVIRIFKRKAEGNIEIETLRAGQLIGEMSFLDDQPRSAAAEAITTAELVEIPRSTLDEALKKLPEWFTVLTRTVVSRLRAANNKIRLLESVSVEYETDKNGNRTKEYAFINKSDLLKFSTALLTVGSRYGQNATEEGIEFKSALLDRFAHQILQINGSKVATLIELFRTVEILKGDLFLTDIRFLDKLIQFLNEESFLEVEKQRRLTKQGFSALCAVVQSRGKAEKIEENKMRVNVGPVVSASNIPLAALQELYDQKFLQAIMIVSATEINVEFDPDQNIFDYRAFWLLEELSKLNESKRK